jgi:mRNA interferase RelE/StbE
LNYTILIERSAQKDLSKIPQHNRDSIISEIRNLSINPRPQGSKKLVNRDAWRIRVGDYRIIYEINDEKLIILVVALGHRKDIYR